MTVAALGTKTEEVPKLHTALSVRAHSPASLGFWKESNRFLMPWVPFVKLLHKLTSSPSFYSISACIACCAQQGAISSALLSVTLQVLLSAEGGDAPAQAAHRSLRHCLSALTLQPFEVFKLLLWCAPSPTL